MAPGPTLAAALLVLLMTGCQPAMSTPDPRTEPPLPHLVPPLGHGPYTGTVADWPLWFVRHDFGAFSYETYGCKVLYNNFYHVDEQDDELQISSASLGSKYPDLLDAGYIGIRNFPSPAIVTWRSKDGTPHKAEIDIGEIFKDRLIRHNVPREDIPEDISIGSTEIILEVNDRTINVYMRARIPLKAPRTPSNPHSDYRNDLIRVFSRTY